MAIYNVESTLYTLADWCSEWRLYPSITSYKGLSMLYRKCFSSLKVHFGIGSSSFRSQGQFTCFFLSFQTYLCRLPQQMGCAQLSLRWLVAIV